jgi:putative transposase
LRWSNLPSLHEEQGMPRQPRFDVPGVPVHLVQRGNNRQACFVDNTDRQRFLLDAREAMSRFDVAVHSYVLMHNHVHLLATARVRSAISRAMQALGRRYVGYFNCRHGRSGTLWEGRYHQSPIGSDLYFWACHRYIELNPVRARLCARAEQHPWSSHRRNAQGAEDLLVTEAPQYLGLGACPEDRHAAYQSLFVEAQSDMEVESIREHLQQQRAYGDPPFQARIAAHVGHVASVTPRGRPRSRKEKGT